MNLSIRWLNQFLGGELDVRQIIETLTNAGIEVESVHDLGMLSGKIVVARVLEVADHPNADKLHVCKVDAGQGEPLKIVCGAPNVAAGTSYPCALVGAVMPEGFEIKKAKIRGEASEGMLCSAKELGLGGDHSGIMALPESWKVGEPFDTILELKVTPNRPDWLSVAGVARELAAMTGRQIFLPKARFKETIDRIEGFVQVSVAARTECPRYACRLVRGVKIGESPLWLRRALEASGLRPINNVVDVTNYVLMELGHPLHAFDNKTLKGGEIRVRLAGEGEKVTLLDGTELTLKSDDLVIADAERPAALAGIMGGQATEVTEKTTDVLLEAAYFDPGTIRRTARRYGLSTDASYRFERGTDRERLTVALGRAAQLVQEVAGGEIIKGMFDIQSSAATTSGGAPESAPIALEIGTVNSRLGVRLTSSEIADYLVCLGFEIRRADGEKLVVATPSHRVDVTRDVDLIEEIARLYGYNRIPVTVPRVATMPKGPSATEQVSELLVDGLAALGFCEAINYSFIGDAQAAAVGFDPARQPRLANPLSVDQAIMRPSLLPGLLVNAGLNQKQGEPRVMLCELGKVWKPGARAGEVEGERQEIGIVWTGATPLHWQGEPREADFYDLKGAVEALVATLGPEPVVATPLTDGAAFHPGRSARLEWKGQPIGEIGELHPDLSATFDLRGRVYLGRLDVDALTGLWTGGKIESKPAPKFPGSARDLAVVVASEVAAGDVLASVRRGGGTLVEDVVLFDVYEGKHVAEGQKSLALRLWIRSAEKTLTEDEIQGVVDKAMARLVKDHGATLRG